MAAQRVDRLPEGDAWLYEVKFDGYRALLLKEGADVRIRSRNDKDLTAGCPGLCAAVARLPVRSATIDGEIVAVDWHGRPSFQALQHRAAHPDHVLVCYAFDLLHVDGTDITDLPLVERRARLRRVLQGSPVLFSHDLTGRPDDIVQAVRSLGLEGVIAKRRESRYLPGARSSAWCKLKLDRQQAFVIGGYRPGPHGVDALLVGVYDGPSLRFAGKVRAGFTPRVRRDVSAHLRPLHAARCAFVDLPHAGPGRWGGGVTADQMAEMQWLEPTLVAQVRFVEWTADAQLRHAAFLALRHDKPARDVRRT